jgi:carbonic anhydrase/acetyltransferase-like protein (isoleucine patch superfamily)
MSIRSYQGIKPIIGEGVYIDDTAVIIGNVTIGKDSAIWPMTVVRGDMHHIVIGESTNIQDGSILHITHASEKTNPKGYPLTIGNGITVGHKVTLHGCTIEDWCLIGMGSLVMDGAHIHSEVILGAMSLVPPGKVLESGYLYVGSPCEKRRPLTQQEKDFIRYSASNYVRLKDTYLKASP